jgi:hypothetical protein
VRQSAPASIGRVILDAHSANANPPSSDRSICLHLAPSSLFPPTAFPSSLTSHPNSAAPCGRQPASASSMPRSSTYSVLRISLRPAALAAQHGNFVLRSHSPPFVRPISSSQSPLHSIHVQLECPRRAPARPSLAFVAALGEGAVDQVPSTMALDFTALACPQ